VSRSDCRLFSLLLLSAAVLLDAGYFSILALACVLLSLAFCFNGFSTTPRGPALPRWAGIVLIVCLGASTALYDRKLDHPVFLVTAALLVVAVLLFSLVRARVAQAAAFALAALAGAVGIAATITWGTAGIDVFQFQQSASSALLHGHNPYTPLVVSPAVVAPGVSTLLHLHFPYGPILPVLEAPFRLLGDVRVLHILAALITAAAVLTLARRAGTIDRAACVVMAFPLSVGMVMSSWVDIITMAFLAVWLVNFRSHPRVATVALALALGAKPTTLIALVPIFFWSVRARRQTVIAAVAAALFVVPFAFATGLSQFYYNVLGVQLDVFPRFNALTIDTFLKTFSLPILPFAGSAIVVAAATILVLRRRPSTYGDLLTGTAILATVSFLVAKWAYFNYYYIPAVLLVLAIAGDSLPLDVPEMIRPPALFLRSVDWLRAAAGRFPRGSSVPGISFPGRQ
jgi:hypothetical protein